MTIIIENVNTLTDFEYNKWFNLIALEKRNYIHSLKKSKDKQRKVLAEKIVKNYIIENTSKRLENIEILKDDYGKPFINDFEEFFSISYCKDLVVCVFDKENIGIDIEYIKPIQLTLKNKIEKRFGLKRFNLKSLERENSIEQFYVRWTRFEALIKLLGKGIKFHKEIDNIQDYFFETFFINNYVISICKKMTKG